jgi:NAD(P) transhydrogenase subunit alpha
VRIGVPKEVLEGERRVGLVPETVARLAKEGFEVVVESGAGRDYNLDENYEEAGAKVVEEAAGVYGGSDLIVKVASPTEEEIGMMEGGQILLCFLNGPGNPELVQKLAEAGVTVFANEAIPRTSVAQSMDALSSMGSIAGYKTALIAADSLGKYVPMLSTAAGTTKAAKVLVFGIAVAGLQAIAIMNRLGAEVFAYDIRPETKEQAQSLGASFIDSDDEGEGEEEPEEDEEDEGWSKEKLERDQELLRERIKEMDIVLTTALVPGRKAPTLVDKAMVESMKPGSVIVDLAAEAGGNCELSEAGETVEHQQVRIIGPVNVPSTMPIHASQLLSRNMHNLVGHITEDRAEDKNEHDLHPNLDFEDEIIATTCIAHDGEVRQEATREALQETSEESEAG